MNIRRIKQTKTFANKIKANKIKIAKMLNEINHFESKIIALHAERMDSTTEILEGKEVDIKWVYRYKEVMDYDTGDFVRVMTRTAFKVDGSICDENGRVLKVWNEYNLGL